MEHYQEDQEKRAWAIKHKKRYLPKDDYTEVGVIEKGIPIPPQRMGSKRPALNRVDMRKIRDMEVGDSMLIKTLDLHELSGRLRYYKSAYDMKFVSRSLDNGYRFWRTA